MEYNTQFIDNISVDKKTINAAVVNPYGDVVNYDIHIEYKVSPGLLMDMGTYKYNVKDRNLKENCEYHSGKPQVNDKKLSFSKIEMANPYTDINAAKNKPYVSLLESGGHFTNILKIPLDADAVFGSGSMIPGQGGVYYFTKFGDVFLDDGPNPWSKLDSYQKFFAATEIYIAANPKTDCILVGVCTDTINPYSIPIPADVETNATTVLLKTWSTWMTLGRSSRTGRPDPVFYGDHNVDKFSKFISNIINGGEFSALFTDYEKNVLRKFILLTKNKLTITADGVKLGNENLYGATPKTYYTDKTRIKNIVSYIGSKFYTYHENNIYELLASNIGELGEHPTYFVADSKDVNNPVSILSTSHTYSVAVITNKIKSDVITIIDDKKRIYTYRKAASNGNVTVSFFELEVIKDIIKNPDEIEKKLDEEVKTGNYITPSEYYSNAISAGEFTSGNSGYEKVGSQEDSDVPDWFWSDTLKNWCIFKQYTLKNTFKLYTWNGKNGWIPFENIIQHPEIYTYNINALKFGIEFSTTYKYNNIPIQYKVVVLKYDSIFSQYDGYTYQTLRIGKIWSDNISTCNRYPFTVGIPTVMRLASGELALLYSLTISGVDTSHPLIYPENIKFLNTVCRQFFGAGDDKTIVDDWKRVEKSKAESDTASAITSMAESTLVDADEINTVIDKAADLSMVLEPFKQYIETDNIDSDAYVERWN